MDKQSRQQHKQAKQVVHTKQHRGCYNENQVGIVEQLCIDDQAALKGGYRYNHSRLQVDSRLQVAIDCRQSQQTTGIYKAMVDYGYPQQIADSQSRLQVSQTQQTAGSYSRLQVAMVDYRQSQQTACRQPQQTAGRHSRLQVVIVDCRQPWQNTGSHSRLHAGSHSRLQVAIVDYRQACSYSQEAQQYKQVQVMHLHDRRGTLASSIILLPIT